MSFSASPANYASHFSWTPPNSFDHHPHPLRSHNSTEEFMADNARIDEPTKQSESEPPEVLVSRTRRSRSFHRRTRSVHSGDGLHVFATPQVPATILPASPRFGHSTGSHPSTPTNADYPVVPVRPPLRPTVSFGSVSRHSYDSTSAVQFIEKYSVHVVEKEVRPRDDDSSVKKKDWKFWGCFGWLGLLKFICDYGATSLAGSLPQVASHLRLSALETFWLPGSYLLAASLAQPIFMRLSLALSCKTIILFGLALFTSGSIVSAVGQNISLVLLGQCIQGIGCGAIGMLTQLTLTQLLAENARVHLNRLASLLFWLGIAAGPILGAVLTQTAGWRSIFYLQSGLSVACFFGLPWLLLSLPKSNVAPVMGRLEQVDLLGWLLLAGGILPPVVSISFGGILHAWFTTATLLPLVVGLVVLGGWALYSSYKIDPIFPVSIFRNKSAAVSCFGAVIHGALLTTGIYFLPIIYQLSGLGLGVTGLYLAPWTFGLLVASLLAGTLINFSSYRLAIWLGWALATLGVGFMIVIKDSTTLAVTTPISVIGGMALGLLIPSLTKAIQSVASKDDEVINAEAIHLCFNTFGQCLGVVMSASIFLNCFKAQVLGNRNLIDDATAYWTHATEVLTYVHKLDDRIRANLALNFFDALRPVWIAACAAAGLAFVLSLWFTEDHKTRRNRISHLAELE